MKRPVWLIALGLVIVAIIAFLIIRHNRSETLVADLVAQFPNATEKRPKPESFEVIDATLNGDTKRAIFVKDPSRLVYTVAIPDNAELRVSLGLLEKAWTIQGDGVLFRILVTPTNGNQDELLNLDLNPFANPSDRGWHDMTLDLSEYAGETVQIFFNTNSSPPSRPPKDDRNGDFPVWGAPRIVTH